MSLNRAFWQKNCHLIDHISRALHPLFPRDNQELTGVLDVLFSQETSVNF